MYSFIIRTVVWTIVFKAAFPVAKTVYRKTLKKV